MLVGSGAGLRDRSDLGSFILGIRGLSPMPLYTYHYKNGRYRLKGQLMLPSAVSGSCWWEMFWKRLNGYQRISNNKESDECCNNCPR